MEPSTICVTGGTGFIGRSLTRRLERENVNVRILTRQGSNASSPTSPAILHVRGDLLDYKSLADFVQAKSVVVHLAYLSNLAGEKNLDALRNLAKACCEKGVLRFIHVSTAIVAGDVTSAVVTETTDCRPSTDYEVSKLALEALVTKQLERRCEVAILRPTCVFGPSGKNLVKLAREITSDSNIVKHLKQSLFNRRRLNLVSVENVAEAIWFLASAKTELRGEAFIVSEDDVPENNYEDVSNFLASALEIRLPRWPRLPATSTMLPAALKLIRHSRRSPYLTYSCEKLQRAGYKKAVAFEEGLRLFVDWYKCEFNGR